MLSTRVYKLASPLKLMKKGVTGLQNVRVLKWCAADGIEVAWNLLYGFPGELPEEYDAMADLVPSLVHLPPPALGPIVIDRFSLGCNPCGVNLCLQVGYVVICCCAKISRLLSRCI